MTNTSTSIRYKNTRHLVEFAGGVSEFAEKLGKSQSQTSQFAGSTPIKGIGNKIARQIEIAFEKPEGWLDVAHTELWDGIKIDVLKSNDKTSELSIRSKDLSRLIDSLEKMESNNSLPRGLISALQQTIEAFSRSSKQPQIDTDEVERVNRLFDDAE